MTIESELGVTLGIDRVVTDRKNEGTRVLYKDTPTVNWVIPERIVLNRWRRKRPVRVGIVFKGTRLPPTTWRAVLACLARGLRIEAVTPAQLTRALEIVRTEGDDTRHLRAPNSEMLIGLVRYLDRRRVLAPLLLRHLNDVDPRSPGVPDLVLFREESEGHIAGVRFAEVKRPRERLRSSQIEELRFLRSQGLKAGVVRLIERLA